MNAHSHVLRALSSALMLAVGTWSVSACGGSFSDGDDGAAGGQSGGAPGSGGSTNTTVAGRGGSSGGSVGQGGSVSKGGSASGGSASGGCEWLGETYEVGDTFPAGDGCNTCSCGDDGTVGCTEAACDKCTDIATAYAEAMDQAQTCDPLAPDPCSQTVLAGLVCGCHSFVNAEQTEAIALAEMLHQAYADEFCVGDVQCEPCLPPSSAYCSPEGRCVDVWGPSCMVGGQIYPSGTTGVPDPFSCNTCDCVDGQLSCTEINCPVECPVGTAPSTQCAQCGPTDGCEVVEHGCLPVCMDLCESGAACLDGVCRNVCG